MEFDDLIGQEFLFYGVDNYMFKLDDTLWEAVEDPDDGYRSCLGAIEIRPTKGNKKIFYREPLAIVRVDKNYECKGDADNDGYELVDTEFEHIWLAFGTDNSDGYYPCFYFNYTPMPQAERTAYSSAVRWKQQGKRNDIDQVDWLFNPREI